MIRALYLLFSIDLVFFAKVFYTPREEEIHEMGEGILGEVRERKRGYSTVEEMRDNGNQ